VCSIEFLKKLFFKTKKEITITIKVEISKKNRENFFFKVDFSVVFQEDFLLHACFFYIGCFCSINFCLFFIILEGTCNLLEFLV
jgi:hypothetical protein